MYLGYQSRALKTRLAIPLLYGVDAVHGHNNVLGDARLRGRRPAESHLN
jgi:hypothetical protein